MHSFHAAIQVSLDPSEISVDETVGSVEVCAVIAGVIERSISLIMSTSPDTALGLFIVYVG